MKKLYSGKLAPVFSPRYDQTRKSQCMNKEFACQQCGIKFYRENSNTRPPKFCSPKCSAQYNNSRRKKILIKSCQQCGKIFSSYHRINLKYCSMNCYSQKRADAPTGKPLKEYICHQCGKIFKRREIDKSQFCSRKCSSFSRKNLAEYICKECGRVFLDNPRTGIRNRKYCSVICKSNEARRILQKPPKEFVCEICNIIFYRKVNQKAKYPIKRFCSPGCRNIGLSNKYHSDLVYREKVLVSKAKSFKLSGTKPELECKEIIEKLSINFEYQYPILPKFIVDFLCYTNIIIQIDGEYWHGHPRFEPLTPKQTLQKKRDVHQDKYLTARGYQVFRIWENDITEEKIKSVLSMADSVVVL